MPNERKDYDVASMRARLAAYLDAERLNNKTFEERCGLYNGFVRAMDSKITFDSLAKIGASCPNLNLGWLFSGEGEMLVVVQPGPVSVQAVPAVNMENVQAVFITNVDAIASAVAKVLGGK